MDYENFYQFLCIDGYVTVSKYASQKLGYLNALFLAVYSYKYKYWKDRDELGSDGSFYYIKEDFEEEWMISDYLQRKCDAFLTELGFITAYNYGQNNARHVIMHWEKIVEFFMSKTDDDKKPSKKKKNEKSDNNNDSKSQEAVVENLISGSQNFNTTNNNNTNINKTNLIYDKENSVESSVQQKKSENLYSTATKSNDDVSDMLGNSACVNNRVLHTEVLEKEKKEKSVNMDSSKAYKNVIASIYNYAFDSEETRDTLITWYNQVGKGRVSVKTLREKLENLNKECNWDENKVKDAIQLAYLNGWYGFFPKNTKFNKLDKSDTQCYTNVQAVRRVQESDYARNPDGSIMTF